MQIQDQQFHIECRILKEDKDLENLLTRKTVHKNQVQQINEAENSNDQTARDFQVQVDRENIEKGYLSEGYEKTSNLNIRKRKNSIIKKVKQSEKKRKNQKNRLYIEMLEGKVYELQKELETAKKLNEMNRNYVKKLSEGEHIMNGLFVSKQRYIENLEDLLKQKELNNEALKKQYSNMRYRQGVFGKDRTKAINYYFSEISELFFSDTLKYLIKTAENNEEFFDRDLLRLGQIGKSIDEDNVVNILGFPNENIHELQFLRDEILTEKKTLNKKFELFYQSKCDIMETARRLETIIDKMQKFLTHEQISKLIVFADQYRFKKGISVKEFHRDIFERLSAQNYQYDPSNLFQNKSF